MEILLLEVLIIVVTYAIFDFRIKDTEKQNKAMLEMQINASKQASVDHVTKASFDDLLKILDKIIAFHTSGMLVNASKIYDLNSEEKSLMLDDLIVEISTKVSASLSENFMTGLLCYVKRDYIMNYIKDTVRLQLIVRIEKR